MVGASLRNAAAVASWIAREHDADDTVVAVVAAGERWPDGTLRPAVEDLWGAGAVLAALEDRAERGLADVLAGDVELVGLEQRGADVVALRLEEREDHAAADEQAVGLLDQVVDDAQLVGDLRPAQHDDVGALGRLGEPLQHLHLGLHETADHGREPRGDVVDAGLLAVHDPEPVGDEHVGQRRELVGERAADGVVLARLALVEADVLEHGHLAVLQRRGDPLRLGADGVVGEQHGRAEQLGEALGHGLQRVGGVRRTLRPAEVRGDEHARTGTGELLDGRDAGAHAAVVGDRAAVQRHVQVAADQHPRAAEVSPAAREQVVDRLGRHVRERRRRA